VKTYIIDGYIVGISQDRGEDTEEYNRIMNAIKSKPTAPEGYTYKLKETLEWELCKSEQSGGM
jgi:hypothetical protein